MLKYVRYIIFLVKNLHRILSMLRIKMKLLTIEGKLFDATFILGFMSCLQDLTIGMQSEKSRQRPQKVGIHL